MYSLHFASSWNKDIRKIDRQFVQRINKKVFALKNDPFPSGARPVVQVPGLTRIGVGDYRVLYAVDKNKKTVTAIHIYRKDDDTYNF
jgi:mRNA interferase RelE/StbE